MPISREDFDRGSTYSSLERVVALLQLYPDQALNIVEITERAYGYPVVAASFRGMLDVLVRCGLVIHKVVRISKENAAFLDYFMYNNAYRVEGEDNTIAPTTYIS